MFDCISASTVVGLTGALIICIYGADTFSYEESVDYFGEGGTMPSLFAVWLVAINCLINLKKVITKDIFSQLGAPI